MGKFKPEGEEGGFGGKPQFGGKPGFDKENLKDKMVGKDKKEGEDEGKDGDDEIINQLTDKFEEAKGLVEQSDNEDLKTIFNEMNELIDKLNAEEGAE
jgi:hypothetical protein